MGGIKQGDKPAGTAGILMQSCLGGDTLAVSGFLRSCKANGVRVHTCHYPSASTVCHAHTQIAAHVLIPPKDASWQRSRGSLHPPSGATAAELNSRPG